MTGNNANSDCVPAKIGCGYGQEFSYDYENRVKSIHRDKNNTAGPFSQGAPNEPKLMEFVYDALGRRVETTEYVDAATGASLSGTSGNANPRKTRHIYFGLETIQEYEIPGDWPGTAGQTLAREFVWGDPERYPEVVAMIRHLYDPVVSVPYHYLHDVLGSVIGLVDATGQLVERYTYDPYGKVFIEKWTGSAWVASAEPNSGMPYSAFGNPWTWTGHRYDAAVGLYHTLYRTYSPTLGRWLQRDPAGYVDSLNLYEYIQSAPITWIDPFGLSKVLCRRGKGTVLIELTDGTKIKLFVNDMDDFFNQLAKIQGTIKSVNVFDHGIPGSQSLGDGAIEPSDPRLQELGSRMSNDGEMCLWGCEVAAKDERGRDAGERYLQQLANVMKRRVSGWTGKNRYIGLIIFGDRIFFGVGKRITKTPTPPPNPTTQPCDKPPTPVTPKSGGCRYLEPKISGGR